MQKQWIDSLPQNSVEELRDIFISKGMTEDEAEAMSGRNEQMARAQGGSILRKNRREIIRLNKHAQGAVLENDYEAYAYAIRKLRDIYRQPYNEKLIQIGWQTTRKQVWELLNAQTSKVQ